MLDHTCSHELAGALKWRLVGPYRGGRVMAVAGHPTEAMVFFFGTSSGGVWKTTNGGTTWDNISDGFFARASVGALAISEADPNVIYVGMGECGMRSNVTHGDGVYKSTDGGRTWQHMGLAETQNIARIRIDPRDPDIVYVAALGHRFGPNPERGVYRSHNGGRSWQHILFHNDHTGAIDLDIDLTNPRVLYAALWEAQLYPWGRTDNGPGSGMFKSSDGGDTWIEISQAPGLPSGPFGRIGICASSVRPERVWAEIDAEQGGMYRSDDGGASWTWLSDDRNFLVRAWYFMHLIADPHDADGVYIVNRKLWHTRDGGRSYRQINVPYVDNHALWVDPRNPQRMILGNDGGAAVSFNGGETWSSIVNQPTAELYRTTADNHFPYRVYGSQQDNSTLCMASRSERGPLAQFDWYDVGGGESGVMAVRPDNPNIVYAGDLPGIGITRYDHSNYQLREIAPWFDEDGQRGAALVYRFNWTVPIALSPHDPNILYVAGNVLFRTTSEGASWDVISPDLTRNDQERLRSHGGSITGESSVTNDYCTISSFAESPCERGVLWVGSDDGLVHCSRDNGATWKDVTPPGLPMWATTMLDVSAHALGCAYVAASAHQSDDFQPYLFKTSDYGQTWTPIAAGIPDGHFIRVVREDPARRGLLYVGTEVGVYMSLDDGAHWQPLQFNLPVVAIYDLALKDGDLIAATHGRSLWILDDLTPLYQLTNAVRDAPAHLFRPRAAYRVTRQAYGLNSLLSLYTQYAAPNPLAGIVATYYLNAVPSSEITLELLDGAQEPINVYGSVFAPPVPAPIGAMNYHLAGGAASLIAKPANENEPGLKWGALTPTSTSGDDVLPVEVGFNRFELSIVYPGARMVPGTLGGGITEPLAVPGTYYVRLTVGEHQWVEPVELCKDPRVSTSQTDYQAQFDLMMHIREKVSTIHDAVNRIRAIRQQIHDRLQPLGGTAQAIRDAAAALLTELTAIEHALIQPNLTPRSGELDGVHFPPRLNGKFQALGYAVARSDDAPTQQSYDLFADLSVRADQQLAQLDQVLATRLTAFNELFRAQHIPAVI